MRIIKNDIFTPDITTTNAHLVYPCVKMEKNSRGLLTKQRCFTKIDKIGL